ncbi:MAG: DUF4892 domain-containing protein [Gammaproteobacteria bacterium]|nr:DUF4892 domain-containing protein [Gammaproteobacteria bacterium]
MPTAISILVPKLSRFGRSLLLALTPGLAAAAADVPGAADPPGLDRFPRAWIIAHESQDELAPQEFIVSAVEKIRRELHIERKLRIDATAVRVTYRIPAGVPLREVIAHYEKALGANALFSCRGRDCGRSNGWANQVFGQAILFGPEANQFYIAADVNGELVSTYVIERGNRRIYAHVEILQPSKAVEAVTNAELTEQLAGNGFVALAGVRPRRDGSIPDDGLAKLRSLSARLRIFERLTVYVVCHLHGPEDTALMLERSTACAEAARDALGEGIDASAGPNLIPFGAGPLLPRAGGAVARIELVLPHRQQRD